MNHPSLVDDEAFRAEPERVVQTIARFPKFNWPRIPSPSINGTAGVAGRPPRSLSDYPRRTSHAITD